MASGDCVIRALTEQDSMHAITALLHRAYARLGAMGLNFTAVDQSPNTTKERLQHGTCYIAEQDGMLVGTVLVRGPYNPAVDTFGVSTEWFVRQDVAHLHQFAVDPSWQGKGVGRALMQTCEAWARARGYRAIALDTAVPATHLRTMYQRAGYEDVDEVQWQGKTYRSVIMRKWL